MKTVVGIVMLGLIVGGIYWLNDATRTEDGQSRLHVADELAIEVELAQPQQRDMVRTVQAPGEVEAFDEVDISSELVSKIVEMPVEEGDEVEAGDLLCRLDDADYRAVVLSRKANVAKLEALITQANADLEKAQRDYDHQRELIEVEATSAMEIANYLTNLIRARSVVEMRKQEIIEAEAGLQAAQEDLAKTVITTPISGVVSQRFADQGEVVITGTMNNPGTRIMVVSDLSKMQVRCRVDEADAALVAEGQTSRIYLQSDTRKSIAGSVLRVGTKGTKPIGRDVVTFETLVLITEENTDIKPGMTANVEIEVARREGALSIPVQAVVYRKRRDLPQQLLDEFDKLEEARAPEARQNVAEYLRLVFCVEEGKAHPRLVDIGISDVTRVEITRGIALSDTLVVGPYRSLDLLKDGKSVKQAEKPKAEGGAAAAEETDAQPSETDAQQPTTDEASETARDSADEAGEGA
ncbi:MAG: efflux RND transporter periplasmic adaptor subunit [Planctomycetes bacterium]|nr:efflux RND transporter periplasmic adaptor subunit [Planctomycetota bacterium]